MPVDGITFSCKDARPDNYLLGRQVNGGLLRVTAAALRLERSLSLFRLFFYVSTGEYVFRFTSREEFLAFSPTSREEFSSFSPTSPDQHYHQHAG